MRAEEIPDFVADILAAGAQMIAIGHDIYLMGEAEVPEEMYEQVITDVQVICDRYGRREHLRREIAAHLRSLGRFIDLDELPPLSQLH
ncbi:hypothetical protein GH983_22090 (plasmid) [Agrobacterium sp. MA01]|uniref:hypothetical protein n=1 Tax=Agrobacterium sp. MA01 TaxID=2664893 RepID=UPI00129B29D4|nr:hypothetical protein [Agrobacterium sp. MA01]QGG93246.1 hypothetical protein GH983_22090 [Agrobacterium sp. MA01]